jgi:membrane complex biogenesis BtpA family protein
MENNSYKGLFGKEKLLIGMIHVPALPGCPFNKLSPREIVDKCILEANIYKKTLIDSVMIENMHDIPYLKRQVGPEITSIMSIIAYEIRKVFETQPVGVQILAGANKDALSAAYNSGLNFIRAEGFVFSHIGDEGVFESDAGELLRYRKNIGADGINGVKIFTDIKKKHSANFITSDVDIAEMAKNAEFFGSDGIIVTGSSTGGEASVKEILEVKQSTTLPVLVGSGVTYENLENYASIADSLIVGSYFKQIGYWKNELDEQKIQKFVEKYKFITGK